MDPRERRLLIFFLAADILSPTVADPLKDSEILRLAQGTLRADHASAWASFQMAWPSLERFICRRLASRGIPARLRSDTGQNVIVRIWRFRLRYRGQSEAAFWAWIRTICDNELRRSVGRLARERHKLCRSADLESDLPIEPSPGPAEAAAQADRLDVLRGCLELLPAGLREVIELLYFPPQLTERAVAELLEIAPSAVHGRKAAALARLAACLDAHGIQE
ncbi:MAG: hypothetical protein AMXMBFR47_36000 [Planctomycetota bacterium]